MPTKFHDKAKDAGNKLRSYILNYSTAATGVFFLALAGKEEQIFTVDQKLLLVFSLLFYVTTVILCLVELRVDAQRFFKIATQLELPEEEQDWSENEKYKAARLWLINASYVSAGIATLLSVFFLITKIA